MVDQTYRSPDQSRSNAGGSVSELGKTAADQALSTGREIKDKVADIASTSVDSLKGQAADFMDAAKVAARDAASQAADKLKETADAQKNVGADYVGNFAETLRRAAREFESDLPFAATYIKAAASSIDGVSEQIKNGDFNDLVRGVQSFARRQPTAFLGIAVLAGFGAVRFLKSSGDQSSAASPSTVDIPQGAYDPRGNSHERPY